MRVLSVNSPLFLFIVDFFLYFAFVQQQLLKLQSFLDTKASHSVSQHDGENRNGGVSERRKPLKKLENIFDAVVLQSAISV